MTSTLQKQIGENIRELTTKPLEEIQPADVNDLTMAMDFLCTQMNLETIPDITVEILAEKRKAALLVLIRKIEEDYEAIVKQDTADDKTPNHADLAQKYADIMARAVIIESMITRCKLGSDKEIYQCTSTSRQQNNLNVKFEAEKRHIEHATLRDLRIIECPDTEPAQIIELMEKLQAEADQKDTSSKRSYSNEVASLINSAPRAHQRYQRAVMETAAAGDSSRYYRAQGFIIDLRSKVANGTDYDSLGIPEGRAYLSELARQILVNRLRKNTSIIQELCDGVISDSAFLEAVRTNTQGEDLKPTSARKSDKIKAILGDDLQNAIAAIMFFDNISQISLGEWGFLGADRCFPFTTKEALQRLFGLLCDNENAVGNGETDYEELGITHVQFKDLEKKILRGLARIRAQQIKQCPNPDREKWITDRLHEGIFTAEEIGYVPTVAISSQDENEPSPDRDSEPLKKEEVARIRTIPC